jgi:hypothetical protein
VITSLCRRQRHRAEMRRVNGYLFHMKRNERFEFFHGSFVLIASALQKKDEGVQPLFGSVIKLSNDACEAEPQLCLPQEIACPHQVGRRARRRPVRRRWRRQHRHRAGDRPARRHRRQPRPEAVSCTRRTTRRPGTSCPTSSRSTRSRCAAASRSACCGLARTASTSARPRAASRSARRSAAWPGSSSSGQGVRPRVICLENVEEFQTWGPLGDDGPACPCPERKGETFRAGSRSCATSATRSSGASCAPATTARRPSASACSSSRAATASRSCGRRRRTAPGAPEAVAHRGRVHRLVAAVPEHLRARAPAGPATMRRIAHGVKRYVSTRRSRSSCRSRTRATSATHRCRRAPATVTARSAASWRWRADAGADRLRRARRAGAARPGPGQAARHLRRRPEARPGRRLPGEAQRRHGRPPRARADRQHDRREGLHRRRS